jgi:hypothetical protein
VKSLESEERERGWIREAVDLHKLQNLMLSFQMFARESSLIFAF